MTQEKIKSIVARLAESPLKSLPEMLKDIRELRTGERRPSVPVVYGYPSSDEEIEAYNRIIETLERSVMCARLPKEPDTVDQISTHFDGKPYAQAGDVWPVCPQCNCSLNFVGQVSETVPLNDGSSARILFVIYFCYQCRPPVTTPEMGFLVAPYWNASEDKAVQSHPVNGLSAPAMQASFVPKMLGEVTFLPSINEVDVEDLGIPIQYYIACYDQSVLGTREAAIHMLGGGPYPTNAQPIACPRCQKKLVVAYTLYLDGIFSILYCQSHPNQCIGFHIEDDDDEEED